MLELVVTVALEPKRDRRLLWRVSYCQYASRW